MNAASASFLPGPSPAPGRWRGRFWPLAHVMWHDLRVGFVVGVGMSVVYLPRAEAAARPVPLLDLLPLADAIFVGWAITGVGIALLYRTAERLCAARWARLTFVVCATASARAIWPASDQSMEYASVRIGLSASVQSLTLELVWTSMICALVTSAYLDRAATRRAADQRLQRLRREQQMLRRRLVESRLQMLQARIVPQLFFEMLGLVRDRYRRDPAGAERLLDHLIVFLRAALPRLRTAMSTIEQELALARAYAALLADAGHTAATLAVVADPTADARPFPAGVLLPLVHMLLHAQPGDRHGTIELRTMRGTGNTRLRLEGAAPAQGEAAADARATLADVYGEHAALSVRQGLGEACVVEVEVDDAAA